MSVQERVQEIVEQSRERVKVQEEIKQDSFNDKIKDLLDQHSKGVDVTKDYKYFKEETYDSEEFEEGEDIQSQIRNLLQNEVERVKEYKKEQEKKKESDKEKIQKLQDENCHLRVTLGQYEKELKAFDHLINKLAVYEDIASCLKKIEDQEKRIKSSERLIASYKERINKLLG
jgi:uncharacterized protein with von Willebrand factor type A (vWA) domain